MEISTQCISAHAKAYKMQKAILLYAEMHRGANPVFASVHDVEIEKGAAVIQPGLAVSKTGLVEALKALQPEDAMPAELFAENLLARGTDHLAWFCKPGKQQVWFDCDELGKTTAQAAHPGLVFIVTSEAWHVFAYKGDGRPTPDTELYVAPFFNVWQGGKICVGNMDLPKGSNRFNTLAWEEAWWRSTFTHPNVHQQNELTKYRGGIFALWRKLLAGKPFPETSLVKANETLGTAFRRVVLNGHA